MWHLLQGKYDRTVLIDSEEWSLLINYLFIAGTTLYSTLNVFIE